MSGDTDPDGSANSDSHFMQLMGFVKKKPQLPDGWIVTQSSTYPDRVYFFNTRTAASTWEPPMVETSDTVTNPCISATSTDSRGIPGQTSKKPGKPCTTSATKSSKTKGASTTTAQNPSSAALNKSKQQLGKAYPSRGPTSSSVGHHQRDAGKTLEGRQRTTGWTEEAISKQDKGVRLQRFKDARSEYVSKKRNLEEKLGFLTPSPPWGVPVRTTNLGGTLTPESLTPNSLLSQGGPSDISSVSSHSSKLGSPTPINFPPKGRKRGHQDFSSPEGHARTKSKQHKSTLSPKSLVHTQENEPARKASRRSGKDDSRPSTIQVPASTKTARNDLRLKLALSRQLNVPAQQQKPSSSASQTATSTTASSTMTSPHQPPASKQSDEPNDKAAEQSAFLAKMKRRRSRHKKKALKQAQESTASLTSCPAEEKIPTTTKKAATQEDHSHLINQGVDFFPVAREEDDSTQMEIDVNTDTVDSNNTSNSQDFGVRIVLDTNALMHDLQFVKELLEKFINGLGRPILVIPWVVMQELDGLKSGTGSGGSGGSAWKAVLFLHKCFMSKHPRVQGEPLRKVSDEADFEITCNDDWILQCCLQHQKKVGPDLVILLSNDKHLCSKAVISGIKAYSTEKLVSSLEDLASILQHRPPVAPTPSIRADHHASNDHSTAPVHRPQTPDEPSLTAHTKAELCDELVSEVKEVLRPALSIVVETEMKKAYDDLWKEIVIVQPPWTFEDLMRCFEKHWMAVFGCFLNKEDNRRFLQIKELTSDTQTSLSVVKTLVTNCIFFCRRLRQHNAYDKAPEQAIMKLGEIKRRCQLAPPKVDQIPSSEELARLASRNVVDISIIPAVLEAIWLKIIQLRALIFEGLGLQHDLDTDRTIVIPSELECQACLNVLCPLLQQLIEALERVTEIPDSLVLEKALPFERLCEVIHMFLQEFIAQDQEKFSSLSSLAFQRFVAVYSNRQLLRNGIIQLTDALTKLAQCQNMLAS